MMDRIKYTSFTAEMQKNCHLTTTLLAFIHQRRIISSGCLVVYYIVNCLTSRDMLRKSQRATNIIGKGLTPQQTGTLKLYFPESVVSHRSGRKQRYPSGGTKIHF